MCVHPGLASPLVALQADIFSHNHPAFIWKGCCNFLLFLRRHEWWSSRVGVGRLAGQLWRPWYHSPWALASPPFPPALPAFRLPRKGSQCQNEQGLEVQRAGWGRWGWKEVKEVFTLSPAERCIGEAPAVLGCTDTWKLPKCPAPTVTESHGFQSTDKTGKCSWEGNFLKGRDIGLFCSLLSVQCLQQCLVQSGHPMSRFTQECMNEWNLLAIKEIHITTMMWHCFVY